MDNNLEFEQLVEKFFSKHITEYELDELKSLLEKDADFRRIFDENNILWQETNYNHKLKHFNAEEAWRNISSKLSIGEKRQSSVQVISRFGFRTLLAVASISLLIGIGGVTMWLSKVRSIKQVLTTSTTIKTDEGDKAHIYLPDSSEVYLNSGSAIVFDVNFNEKERKIKLAGEAFFSVRTNPEKPFVVQFDQMTVTATGTDFNILAYPNENIIETTLESGKLQYSCKGKESFKLSVGQQVVFYKKTNDTEIRNVTTEIYTSWKENKLRLIDTPFEEALLKIARKYNVTFEIKSYDLLDLKYTATFIDESIDEVMQLLKRVSPITYKIHRRTGINDKQYLKPKIVVSTKH